MNKVALLVLISFLAMNSGQAMQDLEVNQSSNRVKWSPHEIRALGIVPNQFVLEYRDDKESKNISATNPLSQEDLTTFLQNFGNRILVCIKTIEEIFPVSDQRGRSLIVSYEKDGEVLESNPLNQDQLNVFLRNIKYLVVGVRLDQPIHEVEDPADIDIN